MTLMDWVNTHSHSNAHNSEHCAAVKASYRNGTIKRMVIDALMRSGNHGLTPDEFNDDTNGLINTTRRRFTDLWKEGVIKQHPFNLERPNSQGNPCVVWVIGEDTNRRPSRYQEMQERIAYLEMLLRYNGIQFNAPGRENL